MDYPLFPRIPGLMVAPRRLYPGITSQQATLAYKATRQLPAPASCLFLPQGYMSGIKFWQICQEYPE
ncbi:MAG: hypothetical protein ABF570_03280 [Acetobacter syzygii]